MKWLTIGVTLLTWICAIWCQDIFFPIDEELTHVSGNNVTVLDRQPVQSGGRCPKDMLLYPGYGNVSVWVCDCRPRFLYFPVNHSCHEAYRQGPCPTDQYVILPKGEAVPRCEKNPCREDGLVPFENGCHPLRTAGGPCAPAGVLGVNETTFDLECIPTDIAPFIILQVPKKQCPAGSRRNALGMCRTPI